MWKRKSIHLKHPKSSGGLGWFGGVKLTPVLRPVSKWVSRLEGRGLFHRRKWILRAGKKVC